MGFYFVYSAESATYWGYSAESTDSASFRKHIRLFSQSRRISIFLPTFPSPHCLRVRSFSRHFSGRLIWTYNSKCYSSRTLSADFVSLQFFKSWERGTFSLSATTESGYCWLWVSGFALLFSFSSLFLSSVAPSSPSSDSFKSNFAFGQRCEI